MHSLLMYWLILLAEKVVIRHEMVRYINFPINQPSVRRGSSSKFYNFSFKDKFRSMEIGRGLTLK